VGGSRPNQKDYVFLFPIQRWQIDAISAANRQSGAEDGCCREKFRIFVAWADPGLKKTEFFRVFKVPFDYPSGILCTAYRKQIYPKPMVPWKAKTLKVCLLLDYLADIGPWRVPKSGHVTITKIEKLRRKIHRVQKCYSFRSTTKNNVVIAEKPFPNSGVTRRLWTLGRRELTLVVNISF